MGRERRAWAQWAGAVSERPRTGRGGRSGLLHSRFGRSQRRFWVATKGRVIQARAAWLLPTRSRHDGAGQRRPVTACLRGLRVAPEGCPDIEALAQALLARRSAADRTMALDIHAQHDTAAVNLDVAGAQLFDGPGGKSRPKGFVPCEIRLADSWTVRHGRSGTLGSGRTRKMSYAGLTREGA